MRGESVYFRRCFGNVRFVESVEVFWKRREFIESSGSFQIALHELEKEFY